MAFLDNSGDIILDVVLTDEGRRRLAQGNGGFNITKFALGDDEINYELYNVNTGSAYQDLEILQTPIFEAFTNNTSAMSSMLVSIPRNNLLYLPILKLNESANGTSTTMHPNSGSFFVAVDGNTEDNNGSSAVTSSVAFDSNGIKQGFILGFSTQKNSNYIRIDAGIDNDAVPPQTTMPTILDETQYTIELDSRLGSIISVDGGTRLSGVVDDDSIALYTVSDSTDPKFVYTNRDTSSSTAQVIAGARSTYLEFRIASSIDLRQSDFLFDKLGGTSVLKDESGSNNSNVKHIDTLVKVTGLNTGYSVDIPVRFVKLNQ
tara:strand:- start:3563 stop:4516 length:954 start_codon:yes stop_codon:yes gene_type:complete